MQPPAGLHKEYVREFIRQFEGTEVSFWLDEDQIPIGGKLRDAIPEGIRDSDFFALFLTPDSVSSGWVKKEIEWAKEQELTVVPILLAKMDIPESIREILFFDVVDGIVGACAD